MATKHIYLKLPHFKIKTFLYLIIINVFIMSALIVCTHMHTHMRVDRQFLLYYLHTCYVCCLCYRHPRCSGRMFQPTIWLLMTRIFLECLLLEPQVWFFRVVYFCTGIFHTSCIPWPFSAHQGSQNLTTTPPPPQNKYIYIDYIYMYMYVCIYIYIYIYIYIERERGRDNIYIFIFIYIYIYIYSFFKIIIIFFYYVLSYTWFVK